MSTILIQTVRTWVNIQVIDKNKFEFKTLNIISQLDSKSYALQLKKELEIEKQKRLELEKQIEELKKFHTQVRASFQTKTPTK